MEEAEEVDRWRGEGSLPGANSVADVFSFATLSYPFIPFDLILQVGLNHRGPRETSGHVGIFAKAAATAAVDYRTETGAVSVSLPEQKRWRSSRSGIRAEVRPPPPPPPPPPPVSNASTVDLRP